MKVLLINSCSATFDELNKYFTISGMPIASSQYWNMVHGYTPDDVRKDEEDCKPCVFWGEIWRFSSRA